MSLRSVVTSLVAVAVACVAAMPAAAASWTQINSGTTSEITAIEYQSPARLWFTTANGEIFTRQGDGTFKRTYGPSSIRLNDIEFQSGGGVGFAVGNAGQVLRSIDSGATWTTVSGIPVSANAAHGTFPTCSISDSLGNVNSVRFAGSNRVWIFAEGSQVAKSEPANPATVGAAGTWVDANKAADNSCKLNGGIYADGYADAFFAANPDVGYIVAASFSTVFLTTNDLATAAQKLSASAGNSSSPARTLAGDPANPNRMWSTAPDAYGISMTGYTEDGYSSSHPWAIANSAKRSFPQNGPYDVAFNGGTVLSAGDAGMILTSTDGRNFYYVDSPALASENWRAVGLATASDAAVGGVGGVLATSSDANVLPDLTPPTVTIAGPNTLAAGQTATFTAAASDTGGSGVDPNGYAWTVNGAAVPGAGASQDLSFPSAGTYSVAVTARDGAGNVSQPATISVTVAAPASPPPAPLPTFTAPKRAPLVGGVAKRKGRFVVFRIKGKLPLPAGVPASKACSGRISFVVLKGKKRIASASTLLSKTCGYAKTIKVRRSKVGSAKKLTLRMSFPGNAAVGRLRASYSVKVK